MLNAAERHYLQINLGRRHDYEVHKVYSHVEDVAVVDSTASVAKLLDPFLIACSGGSVELRTSLLPLLLLLLLAGEILLPEMEIDSGHL